MYGPSFVINIGCLVASVGCDTKTATLSYNIFIKKKKIKLYYQFKHVAYIRINIKLL